MSSMRMLVAYDGTSFSGFQYQPGCRTVQGVLEDALSALSKGSLPGTSRVSQSRPGPAGTAVRLRCAGRTDAGVHALGQVVSVQNLDHQPDVVLRALPSLLPSDVAVEDVQVAEPGFDARVSARWRSYTYLLWCGPAPNPLYSRFATWIRDEVDTAALRQALAAAVGRHDFTSFGRLREDQSPIRRVIEATAVADGPFVRIRVTGESFLHQMVRSLVGTALEVARGRKPLDFMTDALEARDRAAAGPVAPPHGLALLDVGYTDVSWPRRQPAPWPWSDRVVPLIERGCA